MQKTETERLHSQFMIVHNSAENRRYRKDYSTDAPKCELVLWTATELSRPGYTERHKIIFNYSKRTNALY